MKVWFVTGASRGFGREWTIAALERGDSVAATARDASTLDDLVAKYGERILPLTLDVDDREAALAAVAKAHEHFGRLDVVVNNAGGAPPAPAATASPRLHAKIIELNLIAPLHVAQAANAVMQEQPGGGLILMVGSVSGTRPSPGSAAYGAAKAGLHHLATSLAAEWAPAVRVNSVIPGPVGSAGLDPEAVARTVPMGRPATPEEVADACLLLASPLAAYVSGAALTVHGGGEWPGYLPKTLRPGGDGPS